MIGLIVIGYGNEASVNQHNKYHLVYAGALCNHVDEMLVHCWLVQYLEFLQTLSHKEVFLLESVTKVMFCSCVFWYRTASFECHFTKRTVLCLQNSEYLVLFINPCTIHPSDYTYIYKSRIISSLSFIYIDTDFLVNMNVVGY